MNQIDHVELAISRLAVQFKESHRLIAYIKALLCEANTLEQVITNVIEQRWLDTAVGVQLDILGEIVGQSRAFIEAELFDYFGYEGHPQAKGFGMGRYRSIGESTSGIRLLDDEEYRLFIRGKIVNNSTTSTPEEIVAQIKYIFDLDFVVLIEGESFYSIAVSKNLGVNDLIILKDSGVVPKTAGVTVQYRTFNPEAFFGYAGFPGAKGFGEGEYASIL